MNLEQKLQWIKDQIKEIRFGNSLNIVSGYLHWNSFLLCCRTVCYTCTYTIHYVHIKHTHIYTNHSESSTHRPGNNEFIAVTSSSSKSTGGHCGSWGPNIQTQDDTHDIIHTWGSVKSSTSGRISGWNHILCFQNVLCFQFSHPQTKSFMLCLLLYETKIMFKCELLCRMIWYSVSILLSICLVHLADRHVLTEWT